MFTSQLLRPQWRAIGGKQDCEASEKAIIKRLEYLKIIIILPQQPVVQPSLSEVPSTACVLCPGGTQSSARQQEVTMLPTPASAQLPWNTELWCWEEKFSCACGKWAKDAQEDNPGEGRVGLNPPEGSWDSVKTYTDISCLLISHPGPGHWFLESRPCTFKGMRLLRSVKSIRCLELRPACHFFLWVFSFSSFMSSPCPACVISGLDHCSGCYVAFPAQISPFWVFLAMTVRLFFLNDSLIMKFLTPGFTSISCDALSGAQTSLWAFQILHERAPGSTAHGKSGLSTSAKPGSSLFSVHARLIPSPFLILLPVIPSSPSLPNQILPFLQAQVKPHLLLALQDFLGPHYLLLLQISDEVSGSTWLL